MIFDDMPVLGIAAACGVRCGVGLRIHDVKLALLLRESIAQPGFARTIRCSEGNGTLQFGASGAKRVSGRETSERYTP